MASEYKIETVASDKKIKIVWNIKKFYLLPDLVESPPFFPVDGCSIKLKLLMDFQTANVMYLKIKLDSDADSPDSSLKVAGSFKFKDKDGKELPSSNYGNCSFNFTAKTGQYYTASTFQYSYRLPYNVGSVYALKDSVFVLECDLTVSSIISSVVSPASLFQPSKEFANANGILRNIYQKNAFCDFTFQNGKKQIRAHKSILTARSPVFEKMLNHDTLEKQTNSVTVDDIDFQVLSSFIKYLYTWDIDDEIRSDLDSLLALYEVADRYQLEDLMENCAQILISKYLDVKSVCKILHAADLHKDKPLKESTMQFFRHEFAEVTKTPEWARFLKENVQLASEVVSFVTAVINTTNK